MNDINNQETNQINLDTVLDEDNSTIKNIEDKSEPKQEMEHPSKLKHYWLSFHRNVILNARFYTLVISIILINILMSFSEIESRLNQMNQTIKQNQNQYVAVTDSGIIKKLAQDVINPSNFAPIIASYIEKYLPRSRTNLLEPKGLMSEYDNWNELIKYHKGMGSLYEFYGNFVDLKRPENAEHTKGERFLHKYLTKLVISIRRRTIPMTIDVIKYKYNSKTDWIVKDNTFRLRVKMKMSIAGATAGGLKYSNRISYGLYDVKGYIDISQRTELNPFGVRFTSIKATPPKNPSDKVIQKEMLRKKGKTR